MATTPANMPPQQPGVPPQPYDPSIQSPASPGDTTFVAPGVPVSEQQTPPAQVLGGPIAPVFNQLGTPMAAPPEAPGFGQPGAPVFGQPSGPGFGQSGGQPFAQPGAPMTAPSPAQAYTQPLGAAQMPYGGSPQQPYPPQGGYSQPYPGAWGAQTPPPAPKKTSVVTRVVAIIVSVAVIGGAVAVGLYQRSLNSNRDPVPTYTPPRSEEPNPTYTPPTTDSPTDPATEASGSGGSHAPATDREAAIGDVISSVDSYGDTIDLTVTGPAYVEDQVGGLFEPDAGFTYLVFPAQVTYRGTGTFFFWLPEDNGVSVVTIDGLAYETDSTGMLLISMTGDETNPLSLATFEPGETLSGLLVFQVPTDRTSGACLSINGAAGETVRVPLGI